MRETATTKQEMSLCLNTTYLHSKDIYHCFM